jgi:hypothetical protein
MSHTPRTAPADSLSRFLESCIDYSISNKESIDECNVCFEVYHVDDLPVQIPNVSGCNHIFGRTCLALWLSDHNTCPICRTKLYKSSDPPRASQGQSLQRFGIDLDFDYAPSTGPQLVDEALTRILTSGELGPAVLDGLRALVNEALDMSSRASGQLGQQGDTTSGPRESRENTTEAPELVEDTTETPATREETIEARSSGEDSTETRQSAEYTTETRESTDDIPEPQESQEDLALLLAQIRERVDIRLGQSVPIEPIRRRSRLKDLRPRTAIGRVLRGLSASLYTLVNLVR